MPGSCFTPSQYDNFLFAAIGEDRNETPLSVLSALTRLEIDPWQEAARLTQLPRHQAAENISRSLVALPGGRWTASEANTIATRLVELLPQRRNASWMVADDVAPQIALCLVLILIIFATLWGVFVFDNKAVHNTSSQHASVQVTRAVSPRQLPASPERLE